MSYRRGTLVKPYERVSDAQMDDIHKASMVILTSPGLVCHNPAAAEIYGSNGCEVSEVEKGTWNVKIPESVVMKALEFAPSKIVLGARNPENKLMLDAAVPNVYFGTGSETNIYLRTEMKEFEATDGSGIKLKHPVYTKDRGQLALLCESAKLCNALDNVDFFIRNVNVQDEDIPARDKDVNVFMGSLMYMTKHVQAGISDLDRLDEVLKLASIVAGGDEALKDNPLISFITCVIKSPLQMVEDTTDKMIEISRRGLPVVISSCPQGGSTGPIREEGMVSMINAEILAGVTLTQLVNPGAPVLYGAVPVRARLDDLFDLYGAPEFIHYNTDCIQMARRYGLPCYSTAGVGDAKVPGMQATVEKMFAHLAVPMAGAQYVHYAFGLLDKTNVFSPIQAVLDDEHVGIARTILRQASFGRDECDAAVKEVGKVMNSATRLFARHIRKPLKEGLVSQPYGFETHGETDEVMEKAVARLDGIINGPDERMGETMVNEIYDNIEGLVPRDRFEV